jgi:hypothetical protein
VDSSAAHAVFLQLAKMLQMFLFGVCSMSNKKLSFLGITAIISVVLAVFVWQYDSNKKSVSTGRGSLIQGLDPAAVAEISIQKAGASISLKRVDNGFAVANKSMYPASNREINELLTACLDVKTVEVCTKDKANHKDLGVAEENADGIVKFLDSKGNIITGIVVGKEKENRMSYARLVNSDEVWLVQSVPWLKQSPTDYIATELVSVNKANIASVQVSSPDGKYTIAAEPNSGKAILQNTPAGKRQKDSDCDAVFIALENLIFDDVNAVADKADLNFNREYTCLLADSTLYTISIAQKDSKTYVKCAAEFTDKTPVKKEQGVESEDALKKKEAKLLAKEKVVDFQKTCDGWVYEIAEYKAKNLIRPMSEIIEDIPVDANVPAETKKAENPA